MRVEFWLSTAMEVSHYAPIADALAKLDVDVTFCSPRREQFFGADPPEVIDDEVGKYDLELRWMRNLDADAVITIQSETFVHDYRGLKMRMIYGVGVTAPAENKLDGAAFDYHLVPGPFNQRIQFDHHPLASPRLPPERVKVIGYPRLDGWFVDGETADRLYPPFSLYNPPVLLWLPSWSPARFASQIFKLADRFQIWVKPHHGTVFWEPDDMEVLRAGPCRLIDFTEDPVRSFSAARVVLAELGSGAFTEALFLGKKVVALSNPAEVDRIISPGRLLYGRVPISTGPADLTEAIDAALKMNTAAQWHENFCQHLFDSTHGHDGERAARTIIECINETLPR